ncbi:MAG: CDP-alcohol phosphatidyltransferase family protein [Alistipes sp.]|nr:CDP-alcohol phosphatidyltransferase family protein [Alistipes sp.]
MKIRLFTIPNMLTLANLMSGAIAVIAILQYHNYTLAMGLVVLAAVFDFLDGFVARLLKQQSPLGVQLDSLADDVTFGLVPALVMFDMYNRSTSYYGCECGVMGYLGYVTLIIAAFSVLRLAKFNIDTTQSAEFSGLPTPANALLLLSVAMLAQRGDIALYQEHILLLSVAMSFLLISPIRMFALKFKGFGWQGNELRYLFILASALIIAFVPLYSVAIIITLYIVVSTVKWLFSKKGEC